MNIGYGIFDPYNDEEIDRGHFCESNAIEDELLKKIDRERNSNTATEHIGQFNTPCD